MELWRRCFEDTDEFIRFYFERKYSDANSLIYEENGKALSALQMLPYPMRWENVAVVHLLQSILEEQGHKAPVADIG